MFVEGFDPTAALAKVHCSRCKAMGLEQINEETFHGTAEVDRRQPRWTMCPSLYAKCPACGLVGEWPEMAEEWLPGCGAGEV